MPKSSVYVYALPVQILLYVLMCNKSFIFYQPWRLDGMLKVKDLHNIDGIYVNTQKSGDTILLPFRKAFSCFHCDLLSL